MSSYKYKHLTLDDRITIQKALKEGQTFVEIGALLGKDPSTVSKEVKAHLDYRNTGTRSRGYNPCKHTLEVEVSLANEATTSYLHAMKYDFKSIVTS